MNYQCSCLVFAALLLMPAAAVRATQPPAANTRVSVAHPAPYNPNNPFARIIRGELPANKVYEDAHVLAFLDLNQSPPGQVLVISKTSKAQNVLQMTPQDWTQVMLVAQRIAKAEVKALHADGVVLQQNNGAAGGETVFHLHVHVLSRWLGSPPTFARDAQGQLDRRALAAKIAAAIGP